MKKAFVTNYSTTILRLSRIRLVQAMALGLLACGLVACGDLTSTAAVPRPVASLTAVSEVTQSGPLSTSTTTAATTPRSVVTAGPTSRAATPTQNPTEPATVGASGTAPAVYPVLGTAFQLGYNREATVQAEKLVVKFVAVTEDSRCPVSTDPKLASPSCVWAGQVVALVNIQNKAQDLGHFKLTLPGSLKDTNLQPTQTAQTVRFEGFYLKILAVEPLNRLQGNGKPVTTQPGEYMLNLVLGKP